MFGDNGNEFPRAVEQDRGPGFSVNDLMLEQMTQLELYTLRGRIDAILPAARMSEVNLEDEVVRQFQTVRALQTTVLAGNDEPNKKASVVQACATALQMLSKMQAEVHTAERFKRIENLLIKHLKLLPVETAEAFIADYSRLTLELEATRK